MNAQVVIVFLASFAFYLLNVGQPPQIYDEGNVLTSASRIIAGQVPYRDFWSMYAPGQVYLVALVLKLFGHSLFAARIAGIVLQSTLSAVVFIAAKRHLKNWPASLATLMATLWIGQGIGPLRNVLLPLCLFLSALDLLEQDNARPRPILSGILSGLAFIFRFDFLPYFVLGLLPQFFLVKQGRFTLFYKRILRWLGGFTLSLLLLFCLLYFVPLGSIFNQAFIFPITVFPKMRSLPFPPFKLHFYLPIIILVSHLLYYLGVFVKASSSRPTRHQVSLFLFCVALLNYSRVRPDLEHLTILYPICSILLFNLYQLTDLLPNIAKIVIKSLLLPVICYSILLPFIASLSTELRENGVPLSKLDSARHIQLPASRDLTAQFIINNTNRSDRIYVGLDRHDKIFVNDSFMYFLANRLPGTTFHELHPGLADTDVIQRQIISELEQSQVHWVVLYSGFNSKLESIPVTSSPGSSELDQYIANNFSLAQTFDSYRILKKN